MPQDQPSESPAMRTNLAALIAKGHIKDGTVPQDQVPLLDVPPFRVPDHDVPDAVRMTPRQLVPEAHVWNIGDAVRDWTYQAVRAIAQGERLGWDVSLGLAPVAGGQYVTAYLLVIYMPSILINEPELGVVRIIPDLPDQNMVRAAVMSAVGELKDQRKNMTNPNG